uniref:DUSP domain-containing protein n=1 Tax=Plectus sambesii TaxID=2011161 RepID=A0A914WDB5_9BILA
MTVVKSERLPNGATTAMLASEAEEGGDDEPGSSMDSNSNNIFMSQAEAKAIVALTDTHQLIAGEKWFLVDAKWWERFVKQTDTGSSVSSDSVGPIDNSAILVKEIDGSLTLKANMVEKLDYVLVPKEGYIKLKQVFGIFRPEHEMERGIIESGLFKKQMKVEVYPLTLRVALAHRETDAKLIVLSRAQTLADLVERVREALKSEHDKFKLYIHHSAAEDDMYEPIDVEQKGASSSLEDLLYPNQLIVLDQLADDGTGHIPESRINKMNS